MEAAIRKPESLAARLKSPLALICWVLLAFSASAAGALFSPGEWYGQLSKPSFNPPSWVFGPVWTALYIMMGTSAWLVWRRAGFEGAALKAWLFQLGFNAAWTPVFFGLHAMGAALIVIVAMWCAILATIVLFWKHSRAASLLLVPYLLWVSFATVLNATLWQMN